MEQLEPTMFAGETSTNARTFVKKHEGALWELLKPLVPFILGLMFLDVIVNILFYADSDETFSIGRLISSYFYACLLISWYRLVIKGAGNFEPANPLSPKRHELIFIGGIFLIELCMIFVVKGLFSFGWSMEAKLVGLLMATVLTIALAYLVYRIWFFFPAQAVNEPVTLGQAFDKTTGYLWNLIGATILAPLKPILIMLAYMIVVGLVLIALRWMMDAQAFIDILKFILDLPILLYFRPIIMVIGATVVSNYYLHALQKPEGEEKAADAE